MESPHLEFEYGDTDALTAELSGKTDKRKQYFLEMPDNKKLVPALNRYLEKFAKINN